MVSHRCPLSVTLPFLLSNRPHLLVTPSGDLTMEMGLNGQWGSEGKDLVSLTKLVIEMGFTSVDTLSPFLLPFGYETVIFPSSTPSLSFLHS